MIQDHFDYKFQKFSNYIMNKNLFHYEYSLNNI